MNSTMFVPQVLTRDSVTVTVDAVVYYRVSNPTMVTKVIYKVYDRNPPLILGNQQCRGLRALHTPVGGDNTKVSEGINLKVLLQQ